MKIMIIRHGDPDYSIDSLTETGWKEAELLSRSLIKKDIKAFYCSPLGRAKDTAKPTLEKLGREATILPWLQEFPAKVNRPDAGRPIVAWDWLPQDWTAIPEFYDPDKWWDVPVFKEAHVKEIMQEIQTGLDALLAQHGYVREGNVYRVEQANEDTIVLFCHFGLKCALLAHLLHLSPMPLWHGTCAAPSSVTTLVTEERRKGIASFRMGSFGDTSHLYVAGEEPSFAARFCEMYDKEDQRHD